MQTKKSKNEASTGSSLKQALGKPGKAEGQNQQDFIKHCENRRLSTDAVLNYLRTQFPKQYEVAEVVGKWIWLESPAKTKRLASALWLLGFHWNERRGLWQHPCGKFDPVGSHPTDPRTKYRCYFPADVVPA